MGTVAGWGRLSEGGQLPNILQYVSVRIKKEKKERMKENVRIMFPSLFFHPCIEYTIVGP